MNVSTAAFLDLEPDRTRMGDAETLRAPWPSHSHEQAAYVSLGRFVGNHLENYPAVAERTLTMTAAD